MPSENKSYHVIIYFSGLRATYGGGGYVADLTTSPMKAKRLIDDLIKYNWIDYYTRAVFLEFTVYNPNINLFAYVNYLFEFPPTGGVLPFPRVMSFEVYNFKIQIKIHLDRRLSLRPRCIVWFT